MLHSDPVVLGLASESPLFVIHLIGFAAFLWQGLYVLSRGERGQVALLTGAAALATAALFGFGCLFEAIPAGSIALRQDVDRVQWWASVAPAVLWLHLSMRLQGAAAATPGRRMFIQGAYVVAALLTVLGTFTDLVRHYVHSDPPDTAGPLYAVYLVFLLVCAGLALANLARMRGPREGEAAGSAAPRMLLAGGLCFLLGAGYLALRELLGTAQWSEVPAWLLLLMGLFAVGGTVGIRSRELLGTDVRRDFCHGAAGLLVLLIPYMVLSAMLEGFDDPRTRLLALLLIALLTTSHTLYDKAGEWLDRAFFAEPVRQERAAARAYVEALGTLPVGPHPALATSKAFDLAVRRAMTDLSDPTKLATSALLSLQLVAQGLQAQQLDDNRLNRASILKEVLLELLDRLKPAEATGSMTGEACRFYNSLFYPYVRGIGRRQAVTVLRRLQEEREHTGTEPTEVECVAQWLTQLDEATFYRWQRRGAETIAAALRERELAAGGVVPCEAAECQPLVATA